MIIAHGQLVASDSPEGLQKLMKGSMELELTVKSEYEHLESILKDIPGVEALEQTASPEKGMVKVKVTTGENTDVREAVFFALADAKLPIMEMMHSEKSLEDIFLELTEDVKPVEKEKKKLFGKKKEQEAGKNKVDGLDNDAELQQTAEASDDLKMSTEEEEA